VTAMDLGVLVARATIDDAPFARTYTSLIARLRNLGKAGAEAGAGVGRSTRGSPRWVRGR
jgi:hypothetical protein